MIAVSGSLELSRVLLLAACLFANQYLIRTNFKPETLNRTIGSSMITSLSVKMSSICIWILTHRWFREHLAKAAAEIRQLQARKQSESWLILKWAREWSIYTKSVGTKCSVDRTMIKTARTLRKTKMNAHSNLKSATPASRSQCEGASLKKTSRGLLTKPLSCSSHRQRKTIWVRSSSWLSECNCPFRKTSCGRK